MYIFFHDFSSATRDDDEEVEWAGMPVREGEKERR